MLEHTGTGGKTLLVDGFRAAQNVKDEDINSFQILTETCIQSEYLEKGQHYCLTSPVLHLHPITGKFRQIRFVKCRCLGIKAFQLNSFVPLPAPCHEQVQPVRPSRHEHGAVRQSHGVVPRHGAALQGGVRPQRRVVGAVAPGPGPVCGQLASAARPQRLHWIPLGGRGLHLPHRLREPGPRHGGPPSRRLAL